MKIQMIDTTEEMVLNPDYKGLRQARIEVWVEGEKWPVEVGHIRIWNNPELFDAVVRALHECKGEDNVTLLQQHSGKPR